MNLPASCLLGLALLLSVFVTWSWRHTHARLELDARIKEVCYAAWHFPRGCCMSAGEVFDRALARARSHADGMRIRWTGHVHRLVVHELEVLAGKEAELANATLRTMQVKKSYVMDQFYELAKPFAPQLYAAITQALGQAVPFPPGPLDFAPAKPKAPCGCHDAKPPTEPPEAPHAAGGAA